MNQVSTYYLELCTKYVNFGWEKHTWLASTKGNFRFFSRLICLILFLNHTILKLWPVDSLLFLQHCIVFFSREGKTICSRRKRKEVCYHLIKNRKADRYWCGWSEKCNADFWMVLSSCLKGMYSFNFHFSEILYLDIHVSG